MTRLRLINYNHQVSPQAHVSSWQLDNAIEADANVSTGVLMYVVKADDFHLPSFWMNESLKPTAAAMVPCQF